MEQVLAHELSHAEDHATDSVPTENYPGAEIWAGEVKAVRMSNLLHRHAPSYYGLIKTYKGEPVPAPDANPWNPW